MINLITGLPGNGKTLIAISIIMAWAIKENRPVFYSGIVLTDEGKAKLGWTEIDALEWFNAPPGAIVLIDEAQRVFRPRAHGKDVPKHVAQLETHRHQGIDLVLITQHPMLIDNEVRRLAGNHRHVVRVMGMERANVHQWNEVRQDCEKGARRSDSEKTTFAYDKSIYPLYKSAELHTVKRKIPKLAYALLCAPLVIGAGVWYIYGFGKKVATKPATTEATADQSGSSSGAASGTQSKSGKPVFDPVEDIRNYVAVNTPRVAGLPHTMPKYDEITKPTTAPVPAACVVMPSKNRCSCYSQQATPMNVPFNLCVEFARNGYFQDFNPNGHSDDRRALNSSAHLASLDRLPISGASTKDTKPGFVASSADGYGVLGKAGPGVRHPGSDTEVPAQSQAGERAPRVPAGSPWRAS